MSGFLPKRIAIALAVIFAVVLSQGTAAQAQPACFERRYNSCLQRIPSNSGGFSNKNCSHRCNRRCGPEQWRRSQSR
jgi:hypothetical protein